MGASADYLNENSERLDQLLNDFLHKFDFPPSLAQLVNMSLSRDSQNPRKRRKFGWQKHYEALLQGVDPIQVEQEPAEEAVNNARTPVEQAAAHLKTIWTLQNEIDELALAEDFEACDDKKKQKDEVMVALLALPVCSFCGIQTPSVEVRKSGKLQEKWFNASNCGYCGRGGVTSEARVHHSILSRIIFELGFMNEKLLSWNQSQFKRRRILGAVRAARQDVIGNPRSLRPGNTEVDFVSYGGQLQRSRAIVEALDWQHTSIFKAGYDDSIVMLGLE